MTKTALCIGVNRYPDAGPDLVGCVNDAADWQAELERRGFQVTKLVDAQATRAAMTEALRRVIGGAAPGDTVVITFSGHGTFAPDATGDEEDGLDEGLCPYDIAKAGALMDDEIRTLFELRQPGVKLVLLSDSCHSGTVTRDTGDGDDTGPRPRFMPTENWARSAAKPVKPVKPSAQRNRSAFRSAVRDDGDLLISGCREGPQNVSWDTHFKGRPNGAFTYYALKTLRELEKRKPDATYADWHAAITPANLPSTDCPQEPQIVGSDAARAMRIFA